MPGKLWTEVGLGLSWLWHHPLLRFLALLTGGLVFAGGGVGSILGSLAAGLLQRRLSFRQLLVGTTWVWALSWVLFALAPNPLLLALANAIGFTIVPIYMGTQLNYRLAQIPDRLQGRVNSIFSLIAFGVQPLSLALTGVLLQGIGPVATVLVLFLPQLALAVVTTLHPPALRVRSVLQPGEESTVR